MSKICENPSAKQVSEIILDRARAKHLKKLDRVAYIRRAREAILYE